MTTKQLRDQAKGRRDGLPLEERKRLSSKICSRLKQALRDRPGARKILFFYPLGSEVDLLPLAEELLEEEYQIFFPVTRKDGIVFYRVTDLSNFKEGAFHVMEPVCREEAYEGGEAVSLTPGLLFTMRGSRIGYGGGYYDRFLYSHPRVFSIGVCFEEQIEEEIPQETWDVSMDAICTSGQYREMERSNGMDLLTICKKASDNRYFTAKLSTDRKNRLLLAAAEKLVEEADYICGENAKDMERGKANGLPQGLLDRLFLDPSRLEGIAEGMRQVAALPDPIGEVVGMQKRPNGLMIGQKKVPIGVIGVIYEARPNVTADVFALCFKTGNTVILRGGSDAANSNKAITTVIQKALAEEGLKTECISLIEDTSHEVVGRFMKMNQYVDLLIPRGGAGLIRNVVENATIPVIETGTGNCHIFVDESANYDMALDIIENAKTQRIGVCNAAESLVVHEKIAEDFLPLVYERLSAHQVELHTDETSTNILKDTIPATEEDFGKEYLDYKMSVKVVRDLDEAIAHINHYNTGHSEAIVTESYENANRFLDEIDAACVYVNASTRFTDGFEFGFGAEIGISTQKLHARGPMGLEALTSRKYIIYGNGQIRN